MMTIKTNRIGFVALIIAFMMQSCGVNTVYEQKVDFTSDSWNEDSIKTFSFEIAEDGDYDLFYLVKNKTDYPFSNLYIKYNLNNENSTVSNNLQEITLFDKKTGKPYGKGFGNVYESKFYSIRKINLKKGIYTLNTQQYMRTKELKGIMAFGISVEKSN